LRQFDLLRSFLEGTSGPKDVENVNGDAYTGYGFFRMVLNIP